MGDIIHSYDDTLLFIEGLPLDLLAYASSEEREDILSKLNYITQNLRSFEIRYTEHQFTERIKYLKDNSTMDIKSLLFGLSELAKLAKNSTAISGSIISYINIYISIVKRYYLLQNKPVPISITELSPNSSESDWTCTIDKLQLLLSDSQNNDMILRGKVTKNTL